MAGRTRLLTVLFERPILGLGHMVKMREMPVESGRCLRFKGVVRAVGVEPTRALRPCGFSYRLRLSPP